MIFSDIAAFPRSGRGLSLAVGVFDGVHLGHNAVLRLGQKMAVELGLDFAVMTFAVHPAEVIRPLDAPPLLMSHEQRKAALLAYEPAALFWLEPSRALFDVEAKDFLCLLAEKNLRALSVGLNFRFGRGARGTVALARESGQALGYDVLSPDTVPYADAQVSSSAIRRAVLSGRLSDARAMLGHELPPVEGTVEHGAKLGGRLGFPTLNLSFDRRRALPPYGVYAAYVYLEGRKYGAVMNYGVRPTINGGHPTIEAHVFADIGECYGKKVEIIPFEFVRGETRFESVDALAAQVRQDICRARELTQE